jgi:hypothetical protein
MENRYFIILGVGDQGLPHSPLCRHSIYLLRPQQFLNPVRIRLRFHPPKKIFFLGMQAGNLEQKQNVLTLHED